MLNFLRKLHVFPCELFMVACIMVGCNGAPQAAKDMPRIPLSPCQLSASGSPIRLAAQCGKLTVYENRAAKSGRQIPLNIAVIPALGRTPEPDPVFYIAGGPGDAATRSFVSVSSAFRRLNEQRDIILVDQRGTGQSHPLKCASSENESGASSEAFVESEIGACLKQLDADTRCYNTQVAVDDLDQIRSALGYESINLYGVSYGTRVAQTYLRSYPKRVRTVILDGVVPQDEPLGATMASDAQKALDAVFSRCASDRNCSRAFPDLPVALAALLKRVEKEPVQLTIDDPSTGKPTPMVFTRNKLGLAIRLFSYNPETVALLPMLIHDAYSTGDLRRLAAQSMIVSEQLIGSINMGLHHSVVCAEDVPFFKQNGKFSGDVEAEKRAYLGESYQELERICKYWPAARVSPDFKELVRSDTPVLLLSGELDPVTPPGNAAHVASVLPYSLNLVAPGQGHGVITRGCISKIATDFIQKGTVAGLSTGCLQDLKPEPFFLSNTGPQP
jgi:pimeloyl-ACP methyl ester carboxylesterase